MTPISIPQGCDPELATAIARLAREISSSHSITSRRFSVWSLVRRHVDQPFADAIAALERHSWSALVREFVPSLAWQSPREEMLVLAAEVAEASLPRLKGSPAYNSRAESIVSAVTQWDECLRLVGRQARQKEGFGHLIPTLDAMRLLLARLSILRPHVERDVYGVSVRDDLTRRDQYNFCELCWRQSLRSAALSEGRGAVRSRYLSNRFCKHHDPRDPRSQYRADVRYKQAFNQELDALTNLGPSAYSFSFHTPRGADEQEIRKSAYDLVHSRIRTLNSREPGARERVATLLISGLTQAEIARQLGISRQAVSKAIRSLERLILARQLDAELSPRTGESLSLSSPHGEHVQAQVSAMLKEGKTLSQIAQSLGRFRHSLRFLISDSTV